MFHYNFIIFSLIYKVFKPLTVTSIEFEYENEIGNMKFAENSMQTDKIFYFSNCK